MIKVISVAAMIAGLATSSFAGSLNTTTESEPENVFVAAPSSAGLGVPLAIGAAVVAVGLIAGSDNDDVVATTGAED